MKIIQTFALRNKFFLKEIVSMTASPKESVLVKIGIYLGKRSMPINDRFVIMSPITLNESTYPVKTP